MIEGKSIEVKSDPEFSAESHPTHPDVLVIYRNSEIVALAPPGSIARLIGMERSTIIENLRGLPISQARWIHYRTPEVRMANIEKAGKVLSAVVGVIPFLGTPIELGQAVLGRDLFGDKLDPKERVLNAASAIAHPGAGVVLAGARIYAVLAKG